VRTSSEVSKGSECLFERYSMNCLTGDSHDVLYQRPRCIADWHRSSKPLKEFQQDEKAELCHGSFRRAASQQELMSPRSVPKQPDRRTFSVAWPSAPSSPDPRT